MGRAIVNDEKELEIRRMLGELQQRAIAGTVVWTRAKSGVQALIEGHEVSIASGAASQLATPSGTKKRDLAEEARERFERWYHKLGFTAVRVLKPNASNREINRRRRLPVPQVPVFRPATKYVSYEAFMAAVGQANHWTITDQAERQKIGWEPADDGYWFWAEVPDQCLRIGTTWNNLVKAIRLLSLEEYVIVWHAVKMMEDRKLDVSTWCWLRTRFGPGALGADGVDGRVYVVRGSAELLSIACDGGGGRAADVV